MSAGEEDGGEKSHAPSDRRLQQAREKGDTPRSADLTTAAAYGGLALAALAFGQTALPGLGATLSGMLSAAGPLGAGPQAERVTLVLTSWLGEVVAASALWFALPGALALLAVIAQRPALAPSKLAPRASRIDPLSALRQRLGAAGLGEFAKALVKLVVFAAVLTAYVMQSLPRLVALAGQVPGPAFAEAGAVLTGFLLRIALVSLMFGLADMIWQQLAFLRRNRMTRREMLDEVKESEGDPALRQQRRARAIAIATAPLRKAVAGADVVIVNPTHYAVVLAWDRGRGGAPHCVAKGLDEMAVQIRALAAEFAVPIHADPPTARALFAEVAVGQQVARGHYRAVAAAIRFADSLRQRAAR